VASLASINIKFLADLAGFSKQMQNVDRELQKTGKKLQSVGKSLTVGVTVPIVGIGIASLKAASDAEETASKFGTVFRDISADAKAAAEDLVNSYGLSRNASNQLLSDTGDLLTGFGFTQQSALELSTEVNKLAVDLASFTNFSGGAEGASQALTKALLGERESVKSLGISILESDVQAKVLENTQKGLTFETERQAKAFATLQIAQSQSANAIGDYARTSGSFANQMRLIQARISDLGVTFGEILLPFANKLAGVISKLVAGFTDLSPTTKKFIVVLAGIAAAVGPLLALAGTILPALATGFAILTGPIGLVIAGVTAIVAIMVRYWEPIKKLLVDIANYFIDLYNESTIFRIGVEAIGNAFKNMFEVGKFAFEFLKNLIGSFAEAVKNTFVNIGAAVKAILTGDFGSLAEIFKKNLAESAGTFKGFTSELSNDWKTLTGNIETNTKNAIDNAIKGRKIEFIGDDVDAKPVEDAVTNAVSNGVTNGLAKGLAGGGTGSGNVGFLDQLESDLDNLQFEDIDAMSIDVDAITQQARLALDAENAYFEAALEQGQQFIENQRDTVVDGLVENFDIMQARLEAFNEGAATILEQTGESFAEGFGTILGGLASGSTNLGSIAGLFLNTIADMAIRLGKLAISIGIAVEGIKKALQSLNPGVAIAAGIALIALGTLVKSAAANIGGGGNVPAFANGGIVGGSSFFGDKILARVNSGELILNQQQQKAVYEAMNQQPSFGVSLDGQFKLSGEDIILAVERSNNKLNRIG
jgi:hypothetical protein